MKYVVQVGGQLYIVGPTNQIPAGMICEAPAAATNSDGSLIDLVEVDGIVTAAINQERKAARDAERAAAEAEDSEGVS